MTDDESLRHELLTLKQSAAELQQEWAEANLTASIESLETDILEERTASELGVAGAAVLGLGVINTTMKTVLPSKAAGQLVTGAWILGGAVILLRLAAATAAGWAAAATRNARRKRSLLRKIQDLQRRIDALAGEAPVAVAEPSSPEATPEQTGEPDSPPISTGSSVELVEAPGAGEASTAESSEAQQQRPARRSALESWRQYASLGRRKSE